MNPIWKGLLSHELALEASQYRYDNDTGSACFFEADQAEWQLVFLDPIAINAFASKEDASEWIRDEITAFEQDGNNRANLYTTMLKEGFNDPIIAGQSDAHVEVWDGVHRLAIAIVREEKRIPVILGKKR